PCEAALDPLCDGLAALHTDMISTVFLADTAGQHLWPAAGRRVPEDYKLLVRKSLKNERSCGLSPPSNRARHLDEERSSSRSSRRTGSNHGQRPIGRVSCGGRA